MKKNKYESPHISVRTLKPVTNILAGSVVKSITTKVQSQSVEDLQEGEAWDTETEWEDPFTP